MSRKSPIFPLLTLEVLTDDRQTRHINESSQLTAHTASRASRQGPTSHVRKQFV
jgi:hypothetical protein